MGQKQKAVRGRVIWTEGEQIFAGDGVPCCSCGSQCISHGCEIRVSGSLTEFAESMKATVLQEFPDCDAGELSEGTVACSQCWAAREAEYNEYFCE